MFGKEETFIIKISYYKIVKYKYIVQYKNVIQCPTLIEYHKPFQL